MLIDINKIYKQFEENCKLGKYKKAGIFWSYKMKSAVYLPGLNKTISKYVRKETKP